MLLFKCCAAHRHNKIICTTPAQQSWESDDAIQVLCSASAQQNYLHSTSTPIEGKGLMLCKLCSASAQQNHLHNTSTAIEEKAVVLFKCYAAHRHNKIICTTPAQQSRGKRLCYSSVVQRIGTTKSFAQHQHSNRGKSDAAIQVLCSASAQQNYLHNTSTAIEENAMLLFKCCAAHRHNKIICTAQAQQSRESDDAMQVLCSASAQQNYSHNTSTALQGKKVVLFKCCATHRHNKILLCDCYAHHNLLCTAFAQQKIEVGALQTENADVNL